MKYIINNTLIFVVDDGIYFTSSTEVEVKLSSFSSRILCLLIENKGLSVSRENIYKSVWVDYGLIPSNTSLNNNLSFLRKVFRDCGIDDFIVTVPKEGVSIHADVKVEPIYDEEKPIKKRNKKNSSIFLLTLISIASLIMALFSYNIYNKVKYPAVSYIGFIQGCETYSSRKASPHEIFNLFLVAKKYITEEKIKCLDDEIFIIELQKNTLGTHSSLMDNREFYAVCEFNGGKIYSCDNNYYLKGVR